MLALTGVVGAVAVPLAIMFGTTANAIPPGNNGTIKIDGAAFDDAPNNEPHVGCTFQVDFYGFDEGRPAGGRDVRVAPADRSGCGFVD